MRSLGGDLELDFILHLFKNGHAYIEAGRYHTYCVCLQRAVQRFCIDVQYQVVAPIVREQTQDLLR